MKKDIYDVLVIGGGHAGTEAAWISKQFGLNVAIVTSRESGIASAPCNPAIGGVGKGQVVREIDALGGLMGILADHAGIQYRTLNESKGYAVQSTRVQIDRDIYSMNAEKMLSDFGVEIIWDMAKSILQIKDGYQNLFKILLASNESLIAKKIIVTTGTFLAGKLHTGESIKSGGRIGCKDSVSLAELITEIKILPQRFKTGTPPRLDITSIDFNQMEKQDSDQFTRNFHMMNPTNMRLQKQVSCYLTRTNSETLSIIRKNKERSPIFNGQISGIGPRYCPSIEDKAFRYPDKDTHHVFVEPEGLSCDTVYPNGISTSLPIDVQESFVHTIKGLEKAKFIKYGYAVEYDVVDTTTLSLTLEHKEVKGLFFAGQVCGTSGYEEAAGQGIVAGMNASLSFLEKKPVILDRCDSYIGVMIEDLVTNKRDEPYRLFTARSENRLSIREDNTLQRIYPYRKALGLNLEIDAFQEKLNVEIEILGQLIKKTIYYATSTHDREKFKMSQYGPIEANLTLEELLRRSALDPIKTLSQELLHFGALFSIDAISTVAIGAKYGGYVDRAKEENERILKLQRKKINWEIVSESAHISFECKTRIKKIRPETFGQLQRIEGIRPATLAYVAGNLV